MTSRSTSALRKPTAQRNPGHRAKSAAKTRTGESCRNGTWPISIPVSARRKWRSDLAKMDAECVAFETDYKGKLAEQTAKEGGGLWLAEAVRRYEAIDDLAGRLGSYAGLIHAGDSVDPAITKFYGDVSERLTQCVGASAVLRARTQPRRRCRDRTRDADARTRRIIAPGSRICARTSRISSRIASSSCFMRNPRAAMPPGTGCSTRPSPACASRSAAASWRSSRR